MLISAACNCIRKRFILLLMLLIAGTVNAQLKADFTVNNPTGCSPLTVNFTNTSSNTSTSTTYLWSFGNGGTSNDKDAAAVYYDEKTFTVTLTAKEGNQTDTKTATITVYKKPTVDFSVSSLKGCAPFQVTFNSTSTPGDGTIANYFWDFGDGNTREGVTMSTASHKYTFAQKPTIRLTVRNSHSCNATVEKNVLEITQGVRVNFSASKTDLCKLPETISFTNTSTGPGTLSYNWDLGDGMTSTDQAPPQITYSNKGVFPVKLKVTSSEGCSDSLVKAGYINAANFNSKFDLPNPSCHQQHLNFTNSSQPLPNLAVWNFSDNNAATSGNFVSHYYTNTGTFNVQLVNTYGSCRDTVTKQITIGKSPTLSGFVMDKTGACKPPLLVNFEDTTAGAVKWKWNFGTGIAGDTSNLQKPSFTFLATRTYYVTLTVTNAQGCQASYTKAVTIARPTVWFSYTKSSSASGLYGCPGMSIKFKSYPAGDVAEHKWDFGDGTTSTEEEPEHTFNGVKNFTVKLYFKTAAGCEDSVVYFNHVRTYQKPVADFISASGMTICGNSPVQFKDLSDTATRWYWEFGDGGTSTLKNPVYAYSAEGQFTVTLTATNQYCSDTAKKEQFIKLVPPFTNITTFSNNCAERGKIILNQSSSGATGWTWDFGDGSPPVSFTDNRPQVSHTYNRSGVYRVALYTTNGQCTTVDTAVVSVLLKQNPLATADKTTLCGSDTLSIKISNMDTIKYYYQPTRQVFPYPYSGSVVYSDGKLHSTIPGSWYSSFNFKLTNFRPGEDSIRIITYNSYHGCYDTSNYIHLKVSGPAAGFKFSSQIYCAGNSVTFTDTSKSIGNAAIVKWIWDYGDGIKDTLGTNAPVTHEYNGANYFYPRLKVIDANGCYAQTVQNISYIAVYGPAAKFYARDTVVSPNTAVQFFNTTEVWPYYAVTYTWDFGDGSPTSSAVSPIHTYTQSGSYSVKLIAKSTFGCADTMIKQAYIVVKTIRSNFIFTSSYVNSNNCPPLLAKFENKSVNTDSVFWDFGDNSYSDNNNTPTHTYYQSGVYEVTLYAYGKGGSIDSSKQQITVKGPYGTITPSALTGCSPTQITLTADAKNAVNYTWDFGDGFVVLNKDTFSTHSYSKAGIYQPKAIMKDVGGCTSTFLVQDSIIIDELKISFSPSLKSICDSAVVNFTTKVSSFGEDSLKKDLRYHWDFGTGTEGDTSNLKNPSFNYNRVGKYAVTLSVTSEYGCEKIVSDTLIVMAKPIAQIDAIDGICLGGKLGVKDVGPRQVGEAYQWSFGNGSTSSAIDPDSLVYSKAGVYNIRLIKGGANGCSDTAVKSIVIDQLKTTILADAKVLCDSGVVHFKDGVSSFARDSLNESLIYHWNFGTGKTNDTANTITPVFGYNIPARYGISLNVLSSYGCSTQALDTIDVLKKPKANIEAAEEVCAGGSVLFQGGVTDTLRIKWAWDFGNGNSSAMQYPSPQNFTSAGSYKIRLSVFSTPVCVDTVYKTLSVHPNPVIGLRPRDTLICLGDAIQLRAHDGVKYTWTSSDGAVQNSTPAITVSPSVTNYYTVRVVNQFSCSSTDSVKVTVSQPFTVSVTPASDSICATSSLQLSAKGAVRYKWIPINSLNNANIANPIAKPTSSTNYTVVGYGADQCFTDTANVLIDVVPLPTVNAGIDTVIFVGTAVQLKAAVSSNASSILWSPSAYLNCTACLDPVSMPKENMSYVATVKNDFGCTASDTVKVKLECTTAGVFIPNSFTPNGDGMNDIFYPRGKGIKTIKYFRIFNRWGEVIFEKKDFNIDDKTAGWNGTFKNQSLPSDVFVYTTEMICDGGESFTLKGTIMIIQ